MRYAILIEKAQTNSVHVPELPGCVATGSWLEDIEIREALESAWKVCARTVSRSRSRRARSTTSRSRVAAVENVYKAA
jgi:predicted RNase H-like HicB family nuclease